MRGGGSVRDGGRGRGVLLEEIRERDGAIRSERIQRSRGAVHGSFALTNQNISSLPRVRGGQSANNLWRV